MDNQDLKWFERPVRMMRLDYLGAMDRMMNADLDELARSKRDDWCINCEWVVGTPGAAPGLGYQTAFNTPKFEKYPLLGDFDSLRGYLPHARKYGLRVLAYLNMHWFSFDFADQHPGWEQMASDGVAYGRRNPLYGSGTTLCVNGGWRDWAIELIGEVMQTGIDGVFLDGPLFYPGCCYCDSCREKFASLHGAEIPVAEDWSDPNWAKFVDFRSRSLAEFMADSRAAARSVNPDGVAFLNAGTWHADSWRFARCLDTVGDHQDFNGAEAFFHPGSNNDLLLAWAATAKYLMAGGKPAVVFNHHALGPWHYIPLPNVETQLAIAQTVACGANPWFAVFDYALDHSRPAAVESVKEIQSFLAGNEEYYTSTESFADVALLNSSQTSTHYVSAYADFYGNLGSGREENLGVDSGGGSRVEDWKMRKEICEGTVDQSYLGYFEALTRTHIPFDVVLDKQISAEGLARYRVLILPNSACLSDSQLDSIREFVRRGGSVIAEFETGAYDELGRPRTANPLLETLGVSSIGRMMRPSSVEEYVRVKEDHPITDGFEPGRLLARPTYSLESTAQAGASVPSVFMNEVGGAYAALKGESSIPALIANTAGVGRTVYAPSLVGVFYARFKLADYQALIENMVRWARVDPMPITIDCPSTVEMEPRWSSGKNQLLIHLVNNSGDMQRPIFEILPARNVRIRLRRDDVKSVRALRAGLELKCTQAQGEVEFVLPELGIYELVVIE